MSTLKDPLPQPESHISRLHPKKSGRPPALYGNLNIGHGVGSVGDTAAYRAHFLRHQAQANIKKAMVKVSVFRIMANSFKDKLQKIYYIFLYICIRNFINNIFMLKYLTARPRTANL